MATTKAATVPTFAQAGLVFNDATRKLEGGLWLNAVTQGNQGTGTLGTYSKDLMTVQTDLMAEIKAGQFTDATLAHVNTILADITTALASANAAVTGPAAGVAAAETALHNAQTGILNIVAGDTKLAKLAVGTGTQPGFKQVPQQLNGVTANNAPHANLAEIGAIFNDAANKILGGVNANNIGAITTDVNAVITDMQALIANNPNLFGGTTGIHADTVIRQLQLELTYIKQAGVNIDAGRASNDNMLDIIDIVQGDANLHNMAMQNGISGFASFPAALKPATRFQDDQAQTNFWANFIADGNNLGAAAVKLVTTTPNDTAANKALTAKIRTFEKNAMNFDTAQGGIFSSRFDNELQANGTLGAEVAAIIKGLKSGNIALVSAAAGVIHANAADVSGNNIGVGGGTFNANATTAAKALGTAAVATAGTTNTGTTAATTTAAAGTTSTTGTTTTTTRTTPT